MLTDYNGATKYEEKKTDTETDLFVRKTEKSLTSVYGGANVR